jgi:hypothetical protein
LRRVVGEGPLCGHVVGGLLRGVLLEGLRPPSVVWWWISDVSVDIPSSLLSISGLETWCYEACRLISRRLARLRGVCGADVRRWLELDGALGCFGWGGRPGQDLPASFRVLFEELEGVGRGGVRRRSGAAVEFVVRPLAGVGGGVFLAVRLLGVDVARTGELFVATSSVAGSFQAGGCLGCGGGCVAGRGSGGCGVGWGFSGGFCLVG